MLWCVQGKNSSDNSQVPVFNISKLTIDYLEDVYNNEYAHTPLPFELTLADIRIKFVDYLKEWGIKYHTLSHDVVVQVND